MLVSMGSGAIVYRLFFLCIKKDVYVNVPVEQPPITFATTPTPFCKSAPTGLLVGLAVTLNQAISDYLEDTYSP